MGTTSHTYVERAKELLDRLGDSNDGIYEAAARANAYATLAVAAELHDLNQHLRGQCPAPTKEI